MNDETIVRPNGSSGDDQEHSHKFSNPIFADMEALVRDQDFNDHGFQKEIAVIKIQRPRKTWFFRANPDPTMRLSAWILEDKEEGELGGDSYFVTKPITPYLQEGWASQRMLR